MEFNKWLKRKYPKNYQNILDGFKDMYDLEGMFKVQGYRPAIWTGKWDNFMDVKPGDLILANCRKEYGWSEWNGLYEQEHTSETWLGTYDCRFYVAGKRYNQHQLYNKYWEYLKE
jgi:hypothetical protein